MSGDDWSWMLVPRGWFESRRRYQRRLGEFRQRFVDRYEVSALPDGTKVATLRQKWRRGG